MDKISGPWERHRIKKERKKEEKFTLMAANVICRQSKKKTKNKGHDQAKKVTIIGIYVLTF